MWGIPKQARSATMALVYITIGALTVVWTIVWYLYLKRHEASDDSYLWCFGFFLTGLVLMAIGFAVGAIGRNAQQAEVIGISPHTLAAAPAVVSPPPQGTATSAPTVTPLPSRPPPPVQTVSS